MSKNFQPLSSGEVLSVSSDSQIVIGHGTFRVSEFATALKQLMLEHGVGGITPDNVNWLASEGVDCDVLRFGSDGWVKGKVRLHLEFAEDGDGEVSPDPKTEAAIELMAPVAAAAMLESDSEPDAVLDFGGEFDLAEAETDTTAIVAPEAETPVADSEVSAKETITSKDTFVQGEEESFGDLFDDESSTEEVEEPVDDSFDDLDLFAEETAEVEETDATALIESDTDDSLDDLFDKPDLFEETAAPEETAESTAADNLDFEGFSDEDLGLGDDDLSTETEAIIPEESDDDLDLDDDLDDLFAEETNLDLGDSEDTEDDFTFDEPAEPSEPVAALADVSLDEDDDLELEDDDLDGLFAKDETESESELEFGDDDEDDLSFDDLLEETAPVGESDSEEDDALSFDNLLEEPAITADTSDEELTDFDSLMDDESNSEEEALIDPFDEGETGTDYSADTASEQESDLTDSDDTDFSFDELLGDDDTDFNLDDLDDDTTESSFDELAAEADDIDLNLGGEDADFSFDDFTTEESTDSPEVEGSVAALDESLDTSDGETDLVFDGMLDDSADDFSFDDVNETDELSLSGDGSDFSFDDENEENVFDSPEESSVATEAGDFAFEDPAAAATPFDHPFEDSGSDEAEDDLTQDELPPEVDFGSTEDLGEFIDVSMFKKRAAPISSDTETSPFDDLEGSTLETSDSLDQDEDISLGDLFNDSDAADADFNFDDLNSGSGDPLDAVTGEEEEVSADIWDLE
ncbi:MAG: KGK domain-containing protein [Limnothrix sp.]